MATSFQKWLFRFNRLTVVTCVYLCAAVSLGKAIPQSILFKPEAHAVFHILLAFVVVFGSLLLSLETIVSYPILGSYGVLFHMFSPPEDDAGDKAIQLVELRVFLGKFLITLCASATL